MPIIGTRDNGRYPAAISCTVPTSSVSEAYWNALSLPANCMSISQHFKTSLLFNSFTTMLAFAAACRTSRGMLAVHHNPVMFQEALTHYSAHPLVQLRLGRHALGERFGGVVKLVLQCLAQFRRGFSWRHLLMLARRQQERMHCVRQNLSPFISPCQVPSGAHKIPPPPPTPPSRHVPIPTAYLACTISPTRTSCGYSRNRKN